MDLFENIIEQDKFRYTNAIWNELKLNHPMSVGYVTTLIESQTFTTKEQWRDFYYESGLNRLRIAKEQNITLSSNTPKARNLNGNYGRTEEELREKGKKMHEALIEKGNPLNITLAECIYIVKFRVMGETWNGVIMRERNTIKSLQRLFPQCTFKKVDGESDFKYGIDYEMYLSDNLLTAIQIKPKSYLIGLNKEIQKAKEANERKNKDYTQAFGKEVLYVYSSNNGTIFNNEIIQHLQSFIYPLSHAI